MRPHPQSSTGLLHLVFSPPLCDLHGVLAVAASLVGRHNCSSSSSGVLFFFAR